MMGIHVHNWKVLDKTTVPCAAEVALKTGATLNKIPEHMFTEKHRLVVGCEGCGKLKNIVTDTAI